VCAVSVVGTVYALDAAGGKELWRYSLGNPWERWIYNSPVVFDGTVYCGVAPHFVALDLKTGEMLWRAQPMAGDWISCRTSPAADEKSVYAGSNWTNGLFALNRQTGAVVWNKKEGFVVTHSSPVVYGGAVYYAADSKLYALEKETGKELWHAELAGGWTVSSPAVKDSTLVVGSPDGKILAFDARTGLRLWSYQTKTAIGSFSAYQREGTRVMASPVISEDRVYAGSNDGTFYVLSLRRGEKLWSYSLGAPILSSPAISGGNVYVATYDGNVYAFAQSKP
jgi:outer membrane protein assembly factor BamB